MSQLPGNTGMYFNVFSQPLLLHFVTNIQVLVGKVGMTALKNKQGSSFIEC